MPCEVWKRIIGEAFLGSGQESNNQKQHLSRVNLGAVMWVELTEDKVKVKTKQTGRYCPHPNVRKFGGIKSKKKVR